MKPVIVALVATMAAGSTPATPPFTIASPRSAHFIHVPFLPSCMRVSMVQGNPRKGASVQLAQIEPGCLIPAHTHDANTRLILVKGYGVYQVKGGEPTTVRAGDYIFLPAHTMHWFRCLSACTVYNLQDGSDVVHWVQPLR
jgi:quercetin dioxygenase-like cupin family protein